MIGYKVFTHDLRSPIQGGAPVWGGQTPFELPRVDVDQSDAECGAGWNFCKSPATALRIAGLWPNGRPSRLFHVGADETFIRGDKIRSATLSILSEITYLRPAIEELSIPFNDLAGEMVAEQLAWREALGRPLWDPAAVERGLREAITIREVEFSLRKFDSAQDAGVARAAWDARVARDAGATRDAWDAGDAWDAWDAWDARAAWTALSMFFVSRRGWVPQRSDLLSAGIRDAYRHGLGIVAPVGPKTLGWAMEVEP